MDILAINIANINLRYDIFDNPAAIFTVKAGVKGSAVIKTNDVNLILDILSIKLEKHMEHIGRQFPMCLLCFSTSLVYCH